MIYVLSDTHNPYFNIATEEFLMNNFKEDVFYLYLNDKSIIIGKNQNTHSEINKEYVEDNKITIVRRLSGGGAVFHDLGNLNFCFITNSKEKLNFEDFTKPIIETLKTLGVNATFSGRNDLTIEGKKFSGNAQYHYKKRMLHHGTLLLSSNLSDVTSALKVKSLKFKDKSVKSVSSRVTTINEHLDKKISVTDFIKILSEHIIKLHNIKEQYKFSDQEIHAIQKLVDDKYSTWEWNYGRSPKASFENIVKFPGGIVEYYINIRNGVIIDIKLSGDFFGVKEITDIEELLNNTPYNKESILKKLERVEFNSYLAGVPLEEFIEEMF